MEKLYKITALILLITVLWAIPVFGSSNTEYADTLYELGLFKGTDKGYELEKTFTREEAVTTLVRLLGEEKNLHKNTYNGVFDDVRRGRWSFNYVMYCYQNNVTKGTGANTFSPEKPVTAKEYITLIMRLLGYTDIEPENALEKGVAVKLINSEKARAYEQALSFTRDDMVYIMYRTLMTKTAEGEILAYVLADKGVISNEYAEKFDVYKNTDGINDLLEKLLG